MANLQVKSIDNELYESLGRRAAMENRSISQEVVSILKAYLATPLSTRSSSYSSEPSNQQFLDLCGTWESDDSAEEIAKGIRKDRDQPSRDLGVGF